MEYTSRGARLLQAVMAKHGVGPVITEVRNYKVRVRHDGGTVTIQTAATSADAAIAIVMEAEKCPRRAILSADLA